MLQVAYGSEAMGSPTVFRHQKHLKGNKKVVDGAQSGMAITVLSKLMNRKYGRED